MKGMKSTAQTRYDLRYHFVWIQSDHVHFYLGAQPKWSPSEIMKTIKGGMSNKIRELFPELDEVYWGGTFWADGFFVKSAGSVTDKVISEYIKKQHRE